ncbi:MAG: hypothetical protein WAT71_11870 [Ignavibacteria bacterium]
MKIILSLIIILIYTLPLISQPEFKIAVESKKWKDPELNYVILEINLRITNVGVSKGACEDLNGIGLYSEDSFNNLLIVLEERSRGLFQEINAGDHIYCNLSFKVPKSANGLKLKFSDKHGGAEKFITNSYNNYIFEEAENYFTNKLYAKAIENYNIYISDEPSQKYSLNLRIADCYEKIGDKNIDDYDIYKSSDNLENAIENYKECLKYDSKRIVINKKIAIQYELLGDYQVSSSNLYAAVFYYNSSLEYSKSNLVRDKINNINNKILVKEKKVYGN